jgi:hypothetical protein
MSTASAGDCTAGTYYVVSTSYGSNEVLGSSTVYANRTQDSMSVSRTATSTKTYSGTISTTASMTASFLMGKAQVSVGVSFTYSVSTSTSETLTFTVRPGYKGWTQMTRRPTLTTVDKRYQSPSCASYSQETGKVWGSSKLTTAYTAPI